MHFRYYSNIGELGSSGNEDIEIAMVVQHGAARNADDYYCSGVEAAKLWAESGGTKKVRTHGLEDHV